MDTLSFTKLLIEKVCVYGVCVCVGGEGGLACLSWQITDKASQGLKPCLKKQKEMENLSEHVFYSSESSTFYLLISYAWSKEY